MALKARVEDQVAGGGYQITADDTVYKLQFGGALRHYEPKPGDKDRDGNPAQPADASFIFVEATPVNPKSHKPIAGADAQVQYYRVSWDLSNFVPANVLDGDLDKLATKCKVSDDKERNIYRTLATQKGVDTPFTKGSEAGLLMTAIQQGVDINIDFLDELSGIVCTYTEVNTGKKDKQGKDRMLSVPGKILLGPGGEAVKGTGGAKKAAEVEEEEEAEPPAKSTTTTKSTGKATGKKATQVVEEEEEDTPASKTKATTTGKKGAKAVTALDVATRIVEETIESLNGKSIEFDAAKLSKSAKRNATMDDQLEANPDIAEEVTDLLANLKWVTSQMPE